MISLSRFLVAWYLPKIVMLNMYISIFYANFIGRNRTICMSIHNILFLAKLGALISHLSPSSLPILTCIRARVTWYEGVHFLATQRSRAHNAPIIFRTCAWGFIYLALHFIYFLNILLFHFSYFIIVLFLDSKIKLCCM